MSPVVLSLRKVVTFFSENPLVLLAALVTVGLVIAVMESWAGARSDPKK